MTKDEYIIAAWNGDFEAVKRWLDGGGDVNARGSWGGPLIARDPEIFKFLIDNGADHKADYDIIGLQVWEVCPDNVDYLLELGADPNGRPANPGPNDTGETTLHGACSKSTQQPERLRMINALLAYGADVNARANIGVPTQAFWRDVQVVGETPLMRAAAYCSEEIIRRLLEAGADRSIRDGRDESAQSWASRHWRTLEIVELVGPQ